MPNTEFLFRNGLVAIISGSMLSIGPVALSQGDTDRPEPRTLTAPPARVVIVPPPQVAIPQIERRTLQRTPETARGLRPVQNRGLTQVVPLRPPEEPQVARSVAGSDAVWHDPVIPVCWENMADALADGRRWTQEAVEATWETVSNIDFTGWGGCAEDSPGIRIRVAEAGPHVEKLGRGLDGLPNGMTLNFTFASWGTGCVDHKEYCIRALAAHEFGHAIGLTHEHNRDEAQEVCRAEVQGPLPAFFMTSYDPTSVMNYCSPDWNNGGRLSPLDVAGVRMLYGPFNTETPATVEVTMRAIFAAEQAFTEEGQETLLYALTDAAPSETKTLWFCDGNEKLVQVAITGTLVPGKSSVDLVGQATRHASENCTPGAAIGSEEMSWTLTEPHPIGRFGHLELGERDNPVSIEIGARRTVGEERIVEQCETCVAASSEAVFVTGPIPNIPEAGRAAGQTPTGTISAPPLEPLPISDRNVMPLAHFSTAGSNAVWADPVIPVCWETMSASESEARQWTRAAVEATWEHVSNIDLTGWQACHQDSDGIRIAIEDSGPRVTALGRGLNGAKNGMVLNFTFQNWGTDCAPYREFCIRALAVHEFGHAIGLAHEHNRDDRTLCSKEPQGPLPVFIMTAYDPASVMNYCSEDWNNNGQLSPMDVAGVRLLYGPFTEETPALVRIGGSAGFNGSESEDYDPQFDLFLELTDAVPTATQSLTRCNGDDLMMQINASASLVPGKSKVVTTVKASLLEAHNCEPKARLTDLNQDFTLKEPGRVETVGIFNFLEQTDGSGAAIASLSLTPNRVVGEVREVESCETCLAAATEAVFATAPPPALPGLGVPAISSEAILIRSPWPDELAVNFEACADAVRNGPDFGGEAWPEAAIGQLCNNAPSSEEPAACYADIMLNGLDWGGGMRWVPGNAVNLCEGTFDADARIACFARKIDEGNAWPAAIASCKST